ncbi:MAG: hypothetical protein GY758_03595 [Fuerstiella sp.]|nr:hypothetical protein [Fuerstiella sp.]
MTTSDDNPFRAPQSEFEPVESRFQPKLRRLRVCLGLQCTTIAVGVAAALYDIESIVVTGGVLSLFGVLTAFFGGRRQFADAIAFGLSGPAISLFCFGLIFLLSWSPADAQRPVSMIAVVYTTCALPLGLYVWTRTASDSFAAANEEQSNGFLISNDGHHEPTNTAQGESVTVHVHSRSDDSKAIRPDMGAANESSYGNIDSRD